MRLELPHRCQSGPGAGGRDDVETRFSADDDRTHSPDRADPEKHWRSVLFLCDEYHSFATTGESDPTGDEKFFALSRQARCIPIVATQSISSLRSTLAGETWRTLLQTFRTKIFLTLSDDFSARTASELCGKEEQLKLNYSISKTAMMPESAY